MIAKKTPSATISFTTSLDYTVGKNPYGIVASDFNADGKIDLAISDTSFDSVAILIGTGDGDFPSQRDYYVEDDPKTITAGDFNRDGKIDLAVVNNSSNNISVLLGKGDGTFARQQIYSVEDYPSGITAGDFNSDGILDLAVTNSFAANVSILLGKGNGTFKPQVFYTVKDYPTGIGTSDFDNDGRLDLIVVNRDTGSVSLLLGKGNGTFGIQTIYSTGLNPNQITVSDFNADGNSDLAITISGTGTTPDNKIEVFLGRGNGDFHEKTVYAVETFPVGIIAGDVNGDGHPDLVVANQGSHTISVLANNGDGTFSDQISYATDKYPFSVALADFDGDQKLDIATTNLNSSSVSLLLNQSQFPPQAKIDIPNQEFLAGKSFSYTLPVNTFIDLDGDQLIYTATQSDGSELPEWLMFDAKTQTFSGTAPFADPDLTIRVTAQDPGGLTAFEDFKVNVPSPGVTITPLGNLTTTEVGGVAQFNVRLNTPPLESVTVNFVSDNESEGKSLDPALVFTAENWNQPQILTIQGIDDAPNDRHINSPLPDGDIAYNIAVTVVSNDIDYIRGISPPPLSLVNLDDPDDLPKIINGDKNPLKLRDILVGGNCEDKLFGERDIDKLYGGRGDDSLNGGYDDDFVYGEMGNDTLEGGESGNDQIFGDLGDDLLSGGEGSDLLDGGADADEINGDNGADTLNGGDGGDVLNGGNQDDRLDGGGGDDQLYGQEGNDLLLGGAGADTIDGQTGADTMDGGAGADTYYVDAAMADIINDTGSDNANDKVIIPLVSSYSLNPTIENGEMSGSINGSLTGNDLNNTLTGNQGNNTLTGGLGNDVLNGGSGNDKLVGGTGQDSADYSDSEKAITASLASGTARGAGNDILTDIENLLGGSANDKFSGNGNANLITGGNGNDQLSGGSGADTIVGGAGRDKLTGGGDADYFLFNSIADMGIGTARDTIVDFSRTQRDKIDLRQLDANSSQDGIQPWKFVNKFSGSSGEISFKSGVIQFDLNGDQLVDCEIGLTGVTTLASTDFVLV